MESEKYDKIGVKLTPKIFLELLIKFFDGKQFSREEAIEKISSYHEGKGGLPASDNVSNFKKATQNLQGLGIQSVNYGVWRLNHKKKELVIEKQIIEEKTITIKADKEIGQGETSVYIYYYDIYKKYAEINGESIWECKIGRSDIESLGRIKRQVGTSYPEIPHVGLIIHCSNAQQLETVIHQVLITRGKWLENAPGKEWFMTNPMEVESIYNFVCSSKVDISFQRST